MIATARSCPRDPFMVGTVVSASLLALTIKTITGNGLGIGDVFLCTIVIITINRTHKHGIWAAAYFALFTNYMIVPPIYQFTMPSANELILYSCGFAAAFLAGENMRQGVVARRNYQASDAPETEDAFEAECERGRQRAMSLVRDAAWGKQPSLISWEMRQMIERGKWGGYEAGFAHAMSQLLANHHTDDGAGDAHVSHVQIGGDIGAVPVGHEQAGYKVLPQG